MTAPATPKPVVWVPVRCPECGKLLCEVAKGSTVKVKCKQCKVYVEKVAATSCYDNPNLNAALAAQDGERPKRSQ